MIFDQRLIDLKLFANALHCAKLQTPLKVLSVESKIIPMVCMKAKQYRASTK